MKYHPELAKHGQVNLGCIAIGATLLALDSVAHLATEEVRGEIVDKLVAPVGWHVKGVVPPEYAAARALSSAQELLSSIWRSERMRPTLYCLISLAELPEHVASPYGRLGPYVDSLLGWADSALGVNEYDLLPYHFPVRADKTKEENKSAVVAESLRRGRIYLSNLRDVTKQDIKHGLMSPNPIYREQAIRLAGRYASSVPSTQESPDAPDAPV